MSPTPRAAVLVGALAVAAIFVPLWAVLLALVALATLVAVDLAAVRRKPVVERTVPAVLARGYPAPLRLELDDDAERTRVRQPVPPDLALTPSEAGGGLDAELVGRRRGKHELPAPALRTTGPLGLGAWTHRVGEDATVLVYPDLPGARRLVHAVQHGRFRDDGRRRGPLGLGTEFESVRDYSPDDDIRQVNWLASARVGRPMSNQYRVERDRDVICVIDCGRLMAAPVGDSTRLDIAIDAAVAVAMVADEVGDRCGAIAFDGVLRRSVPPYRRGARRVVEALYDLEPTRVESDYARVFRRVGEAKRAFVLVLTDLLEETAARPLVEALPVLARRHAVAVASVTDPDLERLLQSDPARPLDVYRMAVAVNVLAARERAAAELRYAGAAVIEAGPRLLPEAAVRAYLRAKALARL